MATHHVIECIRSLEPRRILTAHEMRHIRDLRRMWDRATATGERDGSEPARTEYHLAVADVCARALHRAIGLERCTWLRVTLPDGETEEFKLHAVYPEQGFDTWHFDAWHFYGYKLRKDGLPSVACGSKTVRVTQAKIERRLLDGSWATLADTRMPTL